MANFTKTINESLRVFGLGPASLWGTMIWGTDNWGYGTFDTYQQVHKVFSESPIFSESLAHREVVTFLSTETITPDVDFLKSTVRVLGSDTIVLDEEVTDLYLTIGIYYYNFISNTNDADDRPLVSYSESTNPSTSYSQTSNPSSTWS